MAKSDRPEDETPPKAKRRRRPPVLELKAKEIGADEASAEKPKNDRAKESQSDSAKQTSQENWRARAAGIGASGFLSRSVLAGVAGVLAGALIVYLFASPGSSGGSDPRVGELTGEVAKLSARIETLAARPPPPPVVSESPVLGQRIDRLTSAIGESEQRLAAIEKRPLPQPADLSGVNQRTASIENTLKELRTSLGDLRKLAEQAPPAATPAAVDQLSARIGGLEERIASLAAPRAAAAANSLGDDLVALNALASAVQSGRPFAQELEATKARLGERAATLAAIGAYAAKGLPTTAVLAERFGELAPELLRRPEAEGGFFTRLFGNASRLVEVRQVGEPRGTSASAIVARTETKLERGDLAGAIDETEALPEPAKTRAASWIAVAKQRRDAEQLLKTLVDATLANAERGKP